MGGVGEKQRRRTDEEVHREELVFRPRRELERALAQERVIEQQGEQQQSLQLERAWALGLAADKLRSERMGRSSGGGRGLEGRTSGDLAWGSGGGGLEEGHEGGRQMIRLADLRL